MKPELNQPDEPPKASDRRFVYLLTVAQKRLQHAMQVEDDGATIARSGLLMAVGDDERGEALGDVGRSLDLGPSALSGLVDRMARSGLVERKPDPDDGRAFRLVLTPSGRQARKAAVARARALNQLLCDGFSDEEMAVVARWLVSVCDKFPREGVR